MRDADVRLSPMKMGMRASCSIAARAMKEARLRATLAPSCSPKVRSRAEPATPTVVDTTLRATLNYVMPELGGEHRVGSEDDEGS